MIQLITSEEVRDRMGIDPALAGGVDSVISSYITSAQLRVEAALETHFTAGTATDVFLLDSSLVGGVTPNGFHRLYLKNGFLKNDVMPTLVDARTDPLPSLDWYAEYDRGIIYVRAQYEGSYVTVNYSYGFDDTHEAPEWLKEILISAVSPLISALQPDNKAGADKNFFSVVNQYINAIASNHRRNPGLVLKPL